MGCCHLERQTRARCDCIVCAGYFRVLDAIKSSEVSNCVSAGGFRLDGEYQDDGQWLSCR